MPNTVSATAIPNIPTATTTQAPTSIRFAKVKRDFGRPSNILALTDTDTWEPTVLDEDEKKIQTGVPTISGWNDSSYGRALFLHRNGTNWIRADNWLSVVTREYSVCSWYLFDADFANKCPGPIIQDYHAATYPNRIRYKSK